MFKTILALAVVASAYLLTSDAKAQIEYTDPITPARACVADSPLCISVPAQRPSLMRDRSGAVAARNVTAYFDVAGSTPERTLVVLTAACNGNPRWVMVRVLARQADGSVTIGPAEATEKPAFVRVARPLICNTTH